MGEGCMCIRLHQSKDSNANLHLQNEVLKMENEQLKNDIINANMNSEFMTDLVNELKEENERLKEVLRKCCPWNWKTLTCMICGSSPKGSGHTDDCEYAKMCGEVKVDG